MDNKYQEKHYAGSSNPLRDALIEELRIPESVLSYQERQRLDEIVGEIRQCDIGDTRPSPEKLRQAIER